MKKTKIFALVLAMAMLAMVAVSCGSSADKVTVNATVSAVVDGETKFGPFDVTVEGTTEKLPTVLDAVRMAFQMNEISHEVDNEENPMGLKNIVLDGVDYPVTNDGENVYGWVYTANGIEPEVGRIGNNLLNEGDVIELTYVIEAVDPEELDAAE